MRRLTLIASWIMMAAAVMGCDDRGDNYLDGSLVKNYNISFKSVRARLSSTQLAIEYVKDDVAALRITLNIDEVTPKSGGTYDLAAHGSVTRYGDFGTLPGIESGELTFDAYSETDGKEISGDFHGKFVSDSGSTQSLKGAFKTKLEVTPL